MDEVTIYECGVAINVSSKVADQYYTWKEEVSLPLEQLGAIGGEFTLCLTQTSLGLIIVMKHGSSSEFNLTDYGSW